jgi:hypothetical protein
MNIPPSIRVLAIFAALIVLLFSLTRGFSNAFKSLSNQANQRQVIAQFNPVACDGEAGQEIHNEELDKDIFTVNIPSGCKSGGIHPPKWWNTWGLRLTGNTQGCKVYIQFNGEGPRGPYDPDKVAESIGWTSSSNIAHFQLAAGIPGPNGCTMTYYTYNIRQR